MPASRLTGWCCASVARATKACDGTVVATAVEEAPQPAALFAVPAGFAKLGRLPGGRS